MTFTIGRPAREPQLANSHALRMAGLCVVILSVVIASSGNSSSPGSAVPLPAQQAAVSDQIYYANARPYLDESLEKLGKHIPELKSVEPANDQQRLPEILAKTAKNVDDFFLHVVDLIARETITQERLNSKGTVKATERVQANYLMLRHGNEVMADIVEFRTNDQGDRLDQLGLERGFLATFGYALNSDYFSSDSQSESRFRYLGDQKLGDRDTYVVAFAAKPGEATHFVTMNGRSGYRVRMLEQGIAWIDKRDFQIVRMRTDLLAPHPEIGMEQQTTDVVFGKVQLLDVANPLWLPEKVKVYIRLKEAGQFEELAFRNEHLYSDYRRYRVSVKMVPPQ